MFKDAERVNTKELSDAPTVDVAVKPVAPVVATLPEASPAAGMVKVVEFSPAVVPMSTIVFDAYNFNVRDLPPHPALSVVAFGADVLFIPERVIVLTRKILDVAYHSSSILVLIVESQTTVI
jgi:hypothetical protein